MTHRAKAPALAAGLAALLALACSTTTGSERHADPRPNIIFIMADDLGYGDLGCYGQEQIDTPHLDRLAGEGMRFTDYYAGSTVCAPSRCTLMTGLHTGHCRIRGNKRVPLEPEDVTIAEVLAGAGYETAVIGKWGLGEPDSTGIPTRQGFDSWFGYLNQRHAHNYYPEYLWRNEERVPLVGNVAQQGVATQKAQYSHDLFAQEALRFLGQPHDRPFFLYLAWTIPHANNEAGAAVGDGMEIPDYGDYGDRDWPQPERGRAAMVSRLDRDVGRIMATLRDLDLDEHTIVFFTSDNGPHSEGGSNAAFFNSSGPLRGIKRSLHDGGIRVPMLVRWPGQIKLGSTSGQSWAHWDVLPTLAEIASVAPPDGIDGASVLETLCGGDQLLDWQYWESHERGFSQAARAGPWKVVRKNQADAPIELYDLQNDLGETTDIAAQHPDLAAEFARFLMESRTDSERWPIPRESP